MSVELLYSCLHADVKVVSSLDPGRVVALTGFGSHNMPESLNIIYLVFRYVNSSGLFNYLKKLHIRNNNISWMLTMTFSNYTIRHDIKYNYIL